MRATDARRAGDWIATIRLAIAIAPAGRRERANRLGQKHDDCHTNQQPRETPSHDTQDTGPSVILELGELSLLGCYRACGTEPSRL
jgi:hypothetical protein